MIPNASIFWWNWWIRQGASCEMLRKMILSEFHNSFTNDAWNTQIQAYLWWKIGDWISSCWEKCLLGRPLFRLWCVVMWPSRIAAKKEHVFPVKGSWSNLLATIDSTIVSMGLKYWTLSTTYNFTKYSHTKITYLRPLFGNNKTIMYLLSLM